MSKTILCDMDSITADFFYGCLDAYKEDTGVDLDPDVIGRWDPALPNGRTLLDYFGAPGFFLNLRPIPGAQEALKRLHDKGHQIVIASSAMLTHAPGEKYLWLEKYFPWIDRKRVNFIAEKWRLKGDILIDDHHENTKAWSKAHPDGITFGITYPYNTAHSEHFTYLVESYTDFAGAWRRIEAFIDDPAATL
jgi:5'-nucleotidase